eukprot:2332083-Pleurochrysis_carterae.AAC.1
MADTTRELTVIHSDTSRFDYLGQKDETVASLDSRVILKHPSSHDTWCEDCLIPYLLFPLVNHPPQFVLYGSSSIRSVSDTKPRNTHRADAQRLVAPRP